MLPHLKLYCVEKPFRHALFVPLAQAHAGCPASPKPLHLWVQSTLMPCLASNLTSLDDHLIFSSLLSIHWIRRTLSLNVAPIYSFIHLFLYSFLHNIEHNFDKMKYRRLDLAELKTLEKDFVRFLASNHITADDWVKLKKENPEKVERLLDVFSDIVWSKTLSQIQYLESVSYTHLTLPTTPYV